MRWWRDSSASSSSSLPQTHGCKKDRVSFEERRSHAYLLYSLVVKYLKSRRNGSSGGKEEAGKEVRKEDLEKLKKEIVEELLAKFGGGGGVARTPWFSGNPARS